MSGNSHTCITVRGPRARFLRVFCVLIWSSKPKVVRSNRSGRTGEIIEDFGDLKIGRGNRVATSEGLSVGLRIGAPSGPNASFFLSDPRV